MENIKNNDQKLLNEIQHGKYIAEKGEEIWNWSSPAGKIRWQRRIDLFKGIIGNNSKDILEIGCGTGLFTAEIAKTNNNLTAIDISDDLINIAKSRISSVRVVFKTENAYSTSFTGNSFDFIIGSSVLHHLDVDLSLKEFFRILKPGGKLVFTEPNMLNPQIFIQKNIPWIKKRLGDSPDETAFIRWTLERKMRKIGFEPEIIPFDFLHPFTPPSMLRAFVVLANAFEKIPVIREISGSLIIIGQKK